MKYVKTFEEFVNENYLINEGKDEDYLKTLADSDYFAKGYETLWGLQSSIKRILGDREIRPDESDVLDAINWLKDGLGNGDPRKTPLGKKLLKMKWVTESFNEPNFTPHKLKNSRLVMKTRDELYYMQSHQLEKLLDQVNKIKNKLQEKYNKEQEGHGRFKIMDSLSADLTYLRSYAKIINYFLGGS